MKLTVRRGVFETNSSSTHSLSVCNKSDWDKWKKGELFAKLNWNWELIEFVTPKEAKKDCFENLCEWYEKPYVHYRLSRKEKEELYAKDKDEFYNGFGYYSYKSYEYAVSSFVNYPEFYADDKIIDGKDKIIFGYYGRI